MKTSRTTRTIFFIIAGLLLACLCLVVGGLAVYGFFGPRLGHNRQVQRGPFNMPHNPFGRQPYAPNPTGGAYSSNGEQIYFTGASQSGQPVLPEMEGRRMMPPGHLSCATCHGPEGRGGQVSMMMTTFTAPDIRWSALQDEGYTTDTLKRAITAGLDESGGSLAWQMPRWQMSAADLNDLVDYIQSLN